MSEYAQGVDVLLSEHAQPCILPPSEGTRFELYIGNTCAAVSSGLLSKRCTIVHFGGGRPQRKPFGRDYNHNSDIRRAVPILCFIVEGQVCKILIFNHKIAVFSELGGIKTARKDQLQGCSYMFSAKIKIITQNTLSRFNIFVYIHILHI